MTKLFPRFFRTVGGKTIIVLATGELGRTFCRDSRTWGVYPWTLEQLRDNGWPKGNPVEIEWNEALRLGLPGIIDWPKDMVEKLPSDVFDRKEDVSGPKPPFCQSYDEARELFEKGELQAWDGNRWEDIPKDCTPFFSRRPEEYRRRPPAPKPTTPKFFVWDPSMKTGRRLHMFETGREVATWAWGRDLANIHVFKRADGLPLDIGKMEKILDAM